MNKKVLTLCASFLLAGSLSSVAFAESFNDMQGAIQNETFDANQYYYVFVKTGEAPKVGEGVPAASTSEVLDVNGSFEEPNKDLYSREQNRSTWWRLEPVYSEGNAVKTLLGFRLVNALTGKALSATKGDVTYDIFEAGSTESLAFYRENTSSYLGLNSKGEVVTDKDKAWFYSLKAVPVEELMVDEINKVNNGYFGLQFGYIKDNKYVNYASVNGSDAFAGKLVAKNTPFGEDVSGVSKQIKPYGYKSDKEPGDNYFIYNETAGAYVVLLKEKWSNYNTNLTQKSEVGKGHKFALMTAKEIIEDQLQAKEEDRKIATLSFKVNMPVVVDYSPLEVVAVNAITKDTNGKDVNKDLEMMISNMDGNDYLTTTLAYDNKENGKLEAFDPSTTVVRFGMNDYIDMSEFYGWAITIKGLAGAGVEGMTIQPDVQNKTNIEASTWTKADYVSFSRPEAQWIVTVENAAIYLTNRETKAKIRWNEAFNMVKGNEDQPNILTLRKESDNIYVADGGYKFEIKKVAELGGETFNHYGVYDKDESEIGTTRTYKVTFADAFGTTSYVGMDGKGNVELTRDEAAAINFDLVKTHTTDTLNNDGSIAENAKNDVFHIINGMMEKNKDGEWVYNSVGDTLSYYRYKLALGDKYLTYNDAKKQFELINEKVEYVDAKAKDVKVDYGKSTLADNFIVKLKENNKVNVVKVINYEMEDVQNGTYNATVAPNTSALEYSIYTLGFDETGKTDEEKKAALMFAEESENTPWPNSQEGEKLLANGEMMFFDFNNAEVQEQQNIYAWNANAQLTIVDKKFDSYRYFATPDTMEFYRVEYADEFLYEKVQNGINFLGMTYDRKTYNPAIYVDTAYIQNTKKPTYLLALAPEIEPSHKYCPTHGIDPDASVCVPEHQTTIPGYVTARYLVSFTDSVAKHAAELKNPYLEDGKYTKLGFVDAVHGVNDLNIIQNGDTVKTYELTDAAAKAALNPVEFAFRIANQETKSFYIESVDNGKVSYIRWQNGVPVLTTDITDAEEFNVRETSENPTANEEISAEEATVSVVATDGAVIVKGAEGKNVIVSTILGKVVANETVNSDNETIAAPAGIVVLTAKASR